jgi:hypothetical protein
MMTVALVDFSILRARGPSAVRRGAASLLLLLVAGCGSGNRAAVGTRGTEAAAPASAPPPGVADPGSPPAGEPDLRHDLTVDERLGGHTLGRHVGRTDEELRQRLGRERDISAASTYPDRATAERVVGLALDGNRGRIDGWARRQGSRPNLVLHYAEKRGPPTGRVMRRGSRIARPADGALVVLRWRAAPGRWFVLTSYPELAR